jgi:ubiquinone biosynthesis protein
MLKHLPRLLAIWVIVARYRLDNVLPEPMPPKVRMLVLLIRLHPLWWISGARAARPDRLRLAFEELGPIFIKFGQLLSTRRDLFPPAILAELVKLQDQVPPFDTALAQRIVVQELGAPLSEKFSRFDVEPLAAASVAQVHTAALPDGREVIVKIIRPDIDGLIRRDMALLKDAARYLESRAPAIAQFHPLKVVSDYEKTLLAELDLSLEAANTIKFRTNFTNSPLLYVPEIHRDWCTKRVMVAERIYGVPITDFEAYARLGISRQQLAERGLTIFFTQVFRDNFFHADMHPGNIYVETHDPQNPRYIALDCAIVGKLPKEDQLAVARLVMALVQRDFAQIISIAHQAGWIPSGVSQGTLTEEVRRLVEPMLGQSMDGVNIGETILGLLDMARTYRLEVPTQFVLLLKTLVHVEGLGRGLYPELDIWTLARPLITAWLKDQIGPAALVRKMGENAPNWLAGLPDMPQMIFDALAQVRQSGQWQERQLQALVALKTEMARGRRRDLLALAGVGMGIAGALTATGGAAVAAGTGAGLVLLWRLVAG